MIALASTGIPQTGIDFLGSLCRMDNMTTELLEETISGKALVAAVNLVNDYRREAGLEPIDDLPKGRPGDVHRCILAQAFNFNCTVSPFGDPRHENPEFGGGIYFKEENLHEAKLLAKLLGTEELDGYVRLSPELAKIARYFDHRRLPQYEEKD